MTVMIKHFLPSVLQQSRNPLKYLSTFTNTVQKHMLAHERTLMHTHILLFNTTKNTSLQNVSNVTHIPTPLPSVRKESSQDACRADYEVLRTSVFSNSFFFENIPAFYAH